MVCDQLRTVGLSSSAPEKLARLLLDMSENGQPTEHGTRFRFLLTHEQIGEFIGASRETVTRTLGTFKHRRLVDFNGSMLTIPNMRPSKAARTTNLNRLYREPLLICLVYQTNRKRRTQPDPSFL